MSGSQRNCLLSPRAHREMFSKACAIAAGRLFYQQPHEDGGLCGHSSQNNFADNLLSFVPRDTFPLRDVGFEVDVVNDTILETFPFELVNGTAWRFQRRVQRAGDCERTLSAGGTLHVACPLSFAGLMARYDVEAATLPREESLELQFFVREGRGRIEVAAAPGKPTQLTALRLSSLKLQMKELNRASRPPRRRQCFRAQGN
ncbi:hypothetical protein MTO96_048052 [Rhipicephalus appendiculatus]